jgi:hypothetical protein
VSEKAIPRWLRPVEPGCSAGYQVNEGKRIMRVWLSGPKRHFDLAIKGTLTPA